MILISLIGIIVPIDLEHWPPVGFLAAGYIGHLLMFAVNCNSWNCVRHIDSF